MANVIRYLSVGGFLESCQSNTFVFPDAQLHDVLLYMDTPSQNILFGSVSNVPSAMRIESNMVHFNHNQATSNGVGIGISNFLQLPTFHRLSVAGPSNSTEGPHMAFYKYDRWVNGSNWIASSNVDIITGNVTVTSNLDTFSNLVIDPHPIVQHLVADHDSICTGLDTYWDGSAWMSSHSNGAAFRVQKSNAKYLVSVTCNVPAGCNIPDSQFRTAFAINSNSFIGIGTEFPHQRITVRAEDADDLGPHALFYTDADPQHPLFQLQNWSHDDISLTFDAFRHSNVWRSSAVNGNFQIVKRPGRMTINVACNIPAGSNISETDQWYSAITFGSNSHVGVGTQCNVTHRLSVVGPSNDMGGPHMGFFVGSNLVQPVMQHWTDNHDQSTIAFDTYWDGTNWRASYSNAYPGMFKFEKSNGLFMLDAAGTIDNIVDPSWSNAWTVIASNNYVGIRSIDPRYPLDVHGDAAFRSNAYVMSNLGIGTGCNVTHRLSLVGPSNDPRGPHMGFFVGSNLVQPAIQVWVDRHDQSTLAFDTYWDGSNWLASYSNASPGFFKIEKSNGLLMLDAGATGSNAVDESWSNAFTVIASNNYVGVRTIDPLYPLDVHGDAMFRSNVYHLSNVLPRSNRRYDLGRLDTLTPQSNQRWRNLYLGTTAANEGQAGLIDIDDVIIHKHYDSGGLKIYNNETMAPSRLWVKELLIGDPGDLLNPSHYLIVASNNGLQLQQDTCNLPPQDFSQLNNLFVATTKVGIGISNMDKTLQVIGDVEFEPVRLSTADINLRRRIGADVEHLSSRESTIATWGSELVAVGQPERISTGGYYDGPYVACTWAQNYFATAAPVTTNILSNAGFTAICMVRFGERDADVGSTNEDIVFALSNAGNTRNLSLKRLGSSPSQLTFSGDDIPPFTTPSNTVKANEWAVYTIRYDLDQDNLDFYKNINVLRIDLVNTHQPISSRTGNSIDDKPNMSGVVGRGNLDLMHLSVFDRFVGGEELLDMQRQLVYRSFSAMKVGAKTQPYLPEEAWTRTGAWWNHLGKRDGGTAYTLVDRSGPYASGTWTVWSTSEATPDDVSFRGAYAAFARPPTPTAPEWATDASGYTTDPFASTATLDGPAMLMLEPPNAFVIESYTVRGSGVPVRSPRAWALQGSWDGRRWFTVDQRDAESGWTARELRLYVCSSIDPCKYVRIVMYANGATSGGAGDRIGLSGIRFYGREVAMQLDGNGLGVGTMAIQDARCSVEGDQSVSGNSTLGRQRFHPFQGSAAWPPKIVQDTMRGASATTNPSSTIKTLDGTLSVQVTTSSSTSSPLRALDGDATTQWTSAAGLYDVGTGSYTGGSTTQGVSGEWIDVNYSKPFRVSSYAVNTTTSRSWTLVGSSDDGVTWNVLDVVTNATLPYQSTRFIISRTTTFSRMNRYRLIVRTTNTGSTSASFVEWMMISAEDDDNDGTVYSSTDPLRNNREMVSSGSHVNHGETWTSESVKAGRLPIETDPDVRLYADVRSFSSGTKAPPANGTVVSDWSPRFSQKDAAKRPVFFRYGGCKNDAYVRFEHQQSLESGRGVCPGLVSNGFTIACLVRFPLQSSTTAQLPTRWMLGSGQGEVRVGRNPVNSSVYVQVIADDGSTVLSTSTSVANAVTADAWAALTVRWRPSDQNLDLFVNHARVGRSTLTTVPATWVGYANAFVAGSGMMDVGACCWWDVAVPMDALASRVIDTWLQGPVSLRSERHSRLLAGLEGGLQVKSTDTHTLTVNRYPPRALVEGFRSEIVGSTYGNGVYVVTASGQPSSIEAFSGPSGAGWYGTTNAYQQTTGAYRGYETTPIASSNSVVDGEWIQLMVPDDIIPVRYAVVPVAPSTDPGTPVSWTLLGSTDGIRWTVLDEESSIVTFPSSFDVTGSITPVAYRWFRWVFRQVVPAPSSHVNVRVAYIFLDGRSRELLTCQNDTVVVLDRLGVGVHQPAAPLHVSGLSVLSGIKVVPRSEDGPWTGNTSNGPWTPSTANANNIAYSGGFVGIGTTLPLYPLHVVGSGNAVASQTYSTLGLNSVNNGSLTGTTTGTGFGGLGWSAYFSSSILAREYHAFSDARLKTGIEPLSAADCLQKIERIEPVSYAYASRLDDPSGRTKVGVVAQDIERVLPEAIRHTSRSLPNIYSRVSYDSALHCLDGVWEHVAVGDVLEVVPADSQGPTQIGVKAVDDGKTFLQGDTLETDGAETVFVVGQVVSDCRTVDTDQLVSLLIGSVKALAQKIKAFESDRK